MTSTVLEPSRRARAVLDTSFWIMACRAEIAANCLDLFEMVVPRAVEAEIRTNDPLRPRGEFPYATLFRHLRDKMLDPPPSEPPPLDRLGPGEAAAIPLAGLLGVTLLVNERAARRLAANLGLTIVTVPETVVGLYQLGVISGQATWRKLDLIRSHTASDFIADAESALAALGA